MLLGYEGIKYNSTKDFADFNVVLFNPEKHKIKPTGLPTVESFKGLEKVSRDFLDLKDI